MSALLPVSGIEKRLKELHLSGMAQTVDVRLTQAKEQDLGYAEFLSMLLEDEYTGRMDRKQKKLYKVAHLPFTKGIEDFDFSFQPSIKKQDIRELATLRFLEKKANILFVGQSGTGKTHLAVSLGLTALGHGKSVLFTTLWEMIRQLQQSRADQSFHKKLLCYLRPDLLIIDELGYKSMTEKTVEDFYEIVNQRYEKGSIIITSNRALSEWDSVFIDKTLTTAVIDRFIHHCDVIQIKGESYRFKHRDTGITSTNS